MRSRHIVHLCPGTSFAPLATSKSGPAQRTDPSPKDSGHRSNSRSWLHHPAFLRPPTAHGQVTSEGVAAAYPCREAVPTTAASVFGHRRDPIQSRRQNDPQAGHGSSRTARRRAVKSIWTGTAGYPLKTNVSGHRSTDVPRHYMVEMGGIEPPSDVALPGLLRAQSAMGFLCSSSRLADTRLDPCGLP